MDDWLTQDHLARFVVDVIDGLDLTNLTRQYAGCGSKAHHPATLLAILVYGYSTGVFSSRKLERATHDSGAFRYIAAGTHPNHDTLATFRRQFIDDLADLFVQVLKMATEMKLLKLGTVCLDGHTVKLEAQLKQEGQELLALAEDADTANISTGCQLPQISRAKVSKSSRVEVGDPTSTELCSRSERRLVTERGSDFDSCGEFFACGGSPKPVTYLPSCG